MAFSQPLYQSSVSHVTTSTTYYHGKCVLIYKLKDFRYWNFDTQFECTGVLSVSYDYVSMKSSHTVAMIDFDFIVER